jgi:hypothetical protein
MFTTLSVQLPTDTLLRLVERLKSRADPVRAFVRAHHAQRLV